jgi:flagellar hook-length control protein FliK
VKGVPAAGTPIAISTGMNVTAPVSQFQPSSDAAQFKPTDSMDSGSNGVGGQDFSSAMQEADNKPARKSAASKSGQESQGGSQLPAGGNTPPSTLPPAPSASPVQNAAAAAPPAGNSAAAAAVGSTTSPGGPATPPPGTASQNANPPAAPGAGNAASRLPQTAVQGSNGSSPAAGVLPLLPTNDSAATDSTASDAANPSAGAANDASTLAATAAAAAASSGAAAAQKSAAATAAASPTVNQASAQLAAAAQAKAASPLAGSQPTNAIRDPAANLAVSTASTNSSSDAAAATDNAAQTAVAAAAAVTAARAGNAADSDDPASQDQMATPDTGPKAAVAATPAMPAPVAAALAGAVAATATATATAATAAVANARTIMNLADVNAGIADKASRDNSPDTSLTAASTDGSVGVAQLMSSAPTTDTSTTTTFKITPPVETADFSQGVADRVSFMVDGNISSAKLQVNPPALGPIEVRIALQGSHAQVSFTSHSALTRDALESSAPKLREMLGSQGFGQVSVDVSQGSYQDRSAQSSPYQSSTAGARDSSVDAVQSAPRSSARASTAVLDAYA